MAAEDVWIRQARTSITKTRRLELLRLEAMMMARIGADGEICGGGRERRESLWWL
jgi:hypothetical protein